MPNFYFYVRHFCSDKCINKRNQIYIRFITCPSTASKRKMVFLAPTKSRIIKIIRVVIRLHVVLKQNEFSIYLTLKSLFHFLNLLV